MSIEIDVYLIFSFLSCALYSRYGIILCQMDYIFIDGVAVLSLGYAMTLSYPEDKLAKVFPDIFPLPFQCVSIFMSVKFLTLLHKKFHRGSSYRWIPGRYALHRVF